MSKYHKKQVLFVRSLLNRPKWYNETITHRNWPMIKRAIKAQKSLDPFVPLPPRIEEIENHLSTLRTEYLYRPQIIKSPMYMIAGVTS